MPMALYQAMGRDEGEWNEQGTDTLWELFAKHLTIMVDCIKEGYDWHYEHVFSEDTPRNHPESVHARPGGTGG